MATTFCAAASCKPSPVGPLILLCLVVFFWMLVPWYFSEEESSLVAMAETMQSLPFPPLILLPVVGLICLQFMFTPSKCVLSFLSSVSFTKSTFFLGGTLVLLLALIRLQTTLQELWEEL
ncbi:hypothetical protein O6H91_04G127200 [Diphasiastrum complanatum]|uniref:Uncharacterized protein n=2 Tax=Diphasiastrum complanatum TaxID=34168 RepID=A0ACC2E1K5_DIPCM|nr:hypothetical protein O6H91_04G079900 [Diphasiastrum complanatum]KAJ7560388.1 hypothetical protein O6H91_04G127200 [Diphasiastrum complanatum]